MPALLTLLLMLLSGLSTTATARPLKLVESALRKEGWWGNGAPKINYQPTTFSANMLAIQAPACQESPSLKISDAEWQYARARCVATGYETVHVYASLARDHNDAYARELSLEDPWTRYSKIRGRVHFIAADGFGELAEYFARLAMDCKVVQFAIISTHGSPGTIWTRTGAGSLDSAISVPRFLRAVLSPCELAPDSRIQFTSCELACGSSAMQLKSDLESLYLNPEYATEANARPLEGLKIHVSTDTAYVTSRVLTGFERFFGGTARYSSRNGLSIIYTLNASSVGMDTPANQVPECQTQ